MNIKALHSKDRSVSAARFFQGEEGTLMAIRILNGKQLKEHITKTPALLVCLEGKVIFKNELGLEEILTPSDYLRIEPMVKHWVEAVMDSDLLLFK